MNAGTLLLAGVLAIPGISAVSLVLIPVSALARVNVLASLLTFLVAAALLFASGPGRVCS
jgi:hypothetical protein